MPIYEYQCAACEHKFEKLQRISDGLLKDCPVCHEASLTKLVSAAAFRLKGNGWYETDFKTGNKKNVSGAESSSESSSAKSSASPGGSSNEGTSGGSSSGSSDGGSSGGSSKDSSSKGSASGDSNSKKGSSSSSAATN